jgi:hypothetical protein
MIVFSPFLKVIQQLPTSSSSSSCHFYSPPFIFPSITCRRRQLLCKMWPIQLAFRLLISCRIFLCSSTLSNTSSFLTWSVQLIFSILLQHTEHYSNLGTNALIDSSSLVQRITLRSLTAYGLTYNVACMNTHTRILNRFRTSLQKKITWHWKRITVYSSESEHRLYQKAHTRHNITIEYILNNFLLLTYNQNYTTRKEN